MRSENFTTLTLARVGHVLRVTIDHKRPPVFKGR